MITTTLNRIRSHSPCVKGWTTLLKHLGKTQADDEPLPFAVILASNGIDDALWCCRAEPQYDKEWRLFAVWCASQVKHLMGDQRSTEALDVATRYANGCATMEELEAAYAAAESAAESAAYAAREAAQEAAESVAYAAYAAREAARSAARGAAWEAARGAAWEAAGEAAWEAAWEEAKSNQAAEFLHIVS